MRILALVLVGTTGLFVGSANAAIDSAAQSDSQVLMAMTITDQMLLAKQGRGGHDDPPGDDHDGLVVIAKQGRGGHDDPPGDDHDGLVVIG